MLPINELLSKDADIMVKIEPQVKNKEGEKVKNKDYKLQMIGGEKRVVTPKNEAIAPFEMIDYTCYILNDDGSKTKGVYEVSKLNSKGELNNVIKQMIELDINKGDIFFLGTNEAGYITLAMLGEGLQTIEEELPTIDQDDLPIEEVDGDSIPLSDIPF